MRGAPRISCTARSPANNCGVAARSQHTPRGGEWPRREARSSLELRWRQSPYASRSNSPSDAVCYCFGLQGDRRRLAHRRREPGVRHFRVVLFEPPTAPTSVGTHQFWRVVSIRHHIVRFLELCHYPACRRREHYVTSSRLGHLVEIWPISTEFMRGSKVSTLSGVSMPSAGLTRTDTITIEYILESVHTRPLQRLTQGALRDSEARALASRQSEVCERNPRINVSVRCVQSESCCDPSGATLHPNEHGEEGAHLHRLIDNPDPRWLRLVTSKAN